MIYCPDCRFRIVSNLRSGAYYCAYHNAPNETILGCECGESKITTNADSFRAKSDEELAKWISHIAYCSDCPIDRQCPISVAEQCQGNKSKCYLAWLEWLKSEA